MEASLGKIPTTSARRFTSLFSRSIGFVECSPGRGAGGGVRAGPPKAADCPVDGLRQERAEPNVGENIVLAGIHQVGQLWPARAQLFGDLAPGLAGMGPVGLIEGLPDRGGDDGVLAAGE